MTFKKHGPGCPCDCNVIVNECGCSSTQIKITIADAPDIVETSNTITPCNNLEFAGFSAINGEYYVDWVFGGATIELGRWASTSGAQQDDFGNWYCVFMRLFVVINTPPADDCFGRLCLCIDRIFVDGDSCPDLEGYAFASGCLDLVCGAGGEDNDMDISLCFSSYQISSFMTTNSFCPYDYTVTMSSDPV